MFKQWSLAVSRTRSADQFCVLGFLLVSLMVCSCDPGGGGRDVGNDAPTVNKGGARDWQKVIYECISKVEQADAAFYRRGAKVTGKKLAQEMRRNLRIVLRHNSVPDPFGRNAGIVLAVITTHEGYAMDGITGPPTPYEVEVGGRRMKVYDWLKAELGLGILPGEEEGHEVLVQVYDAVVTPDLLMRWEEYLDKCIEVTRQAEDCRFYLAGTYFSAAGTADIFESNRGRALQRLKEPGIKHPDDRDLYSESSVLLELTDAPYPQPESFSDRAEYLRALHRRLTEGWRNYVEHRGSREDLIDWLRRKAGEPPPMPKLKKKGKSGG